ncbi:Potassium transporter 26 [Camellia lanceoleosa]|uniref:Potassium transporter 26 n=1 Tax=Camellia lanceoleosa TaxID=1840588 RepID=A0ACC0HBF4_9ERIC|nr:Potassium transporter 26 [Camellia lanceoleosa]
MEDTKLSNGVGVEGDIETGSIGGESGRGAVSCDVPCSDSSEVETKGLRDRTMSFFHLYQPHPRKPKEYHSVQTLLLAYQSLGIVYGDLGTSPLYVFSSIRLSNPGEEDLLGIFSLIFWTITWIALIKYVFIVLRADDHGEGGAEAMFADLGHFNKNSIQLAFSSFVYPALVITYAGEAAYLIKHPHQIGNAFYSSIPEPVYWPMFVVSTLAAIVASQSMISATFSIVKQSLALGCFPRVNMVHTSSKHEGQVYSPEINYTLMIICIALVVGFQDGVQLGNAFGVVVVWVMIITTCLITLVMLVIWDTNLILVCGFFTIFVTIEGVYMTSLLNKVPQGGWAPFAISAFFLTVMLSWTYGRSQKSIYEAQQKMSLRELDDTLSSASVQRPQGICFFCTDLVNGIPPIIRRYIHHANSVREIMVIVTVRTLPITTVLPEERLVVGKLGLDGVYRCLVQFGYKDLPSMEGDDYVSSVVAKLCEQAETTGEIEKLGSAMKEGVVFVMGRTILKANKDRRWLLRFTINYLYRFLQKNCRSGVSTLKVPQEKTLQVGMFYEI